jgi:hypothetical protein
MNKGENSKINIFKNNKMTLKAYKDNWYDFMWRLNKKI